MTGSRRRRGFTALLAGFLVLTVVPGVAAAQSGAGGTIVVDRGLERRSARDATPTPRGVADY